MMMLVFGGKIAQKLTIKRSFAISLDGRTTAISGSCRSVGCWCLAVDLICCLAKPSWRLLGSVARLDRLNAGHKIPV